MTKGANLGRFVLLHHVVPRNDLPAESQRADDENAGNRPDHWDLMIESGPVLWTWELLQLPLANTPQIVRRLPDHRKQYLDFEGPISGNRGHVRRCDSGPFQVVQADPAEENAPQNLMVSLQGNLLRGTLHLSRLGASDEYQLVFRPEQTS